MFSNSKYFSIGLSVIIHVILFLFLLNFYCVTNRQDSSLVEIGLGGTPGGGNGGEPNVKPQTVEEKIPVNEKKVTTAKTNEPVKSKAPEKEGVLNNSGLKGSGTGSGTGTGSGNGNGPGTGSGTPPILIPIPKVVPKPVDETYYVAVEQMPEPIGGMEGINDKINPSVKSGSTKGTVYILAFIDEKGAVRKVMLSKGIGGEADQAALNAIRRTRFHAGRKAGVTVKVQMLMGVHF